MHILHEKIKVNFQVVGKAEIWVICAFSLDSSSVHLSYNRSIYISAVSFQYASYCDTPWKVVAEIQEWGLCE